jgi:hypothetical protein
MALGLSLRAGSDARGRRRAPQLVALAFGLFWLAVAASAFGVLAGAKVLWTEIAGTIAWLRRPDNRIGPSAGASTSPNASTPR